MLNIKFPETNLVKCAFSLRTNDRYGMCSYDEFDRMNRSDVRDVKKYTYKVPEYLQGLLMPGDVVVVHCTTGYQLCEVTEINVIEGSKGKDWAPVVCKVDLSMYFEEIQKKQAMDMVRKQLEEKKKQLEALVTYELLAEKNPEFKELLDHYKKLGGTL